VKRPETEKFLLDVLKRSDALRLYRGKRASNPVENPYWMNLLDGAAKALEVVAIGTLDWKLGAISKLLQSWLDDKKKEHAETQRKTEYGYNVNLLNAPSSGGGSWDHTYY
jgi:hypothetical protein